MHPDIAWAVEQAGEVYGLGWDWRLRELCKVITDDLPTRVEDPYDWRAEGFDEAHSEVAELCLTDNDEYLDRASGTISVDWDTTGLLVALDGVIEQGRRRATQAAVNAVKAKRAEVDEELQADVDELDEDDEDRPDAVGYHRDKVAAFDAVLEWFAQTYHVVPEEVPA